MMYNCVIIDDEQPARALIASFVEKVPFLQNVGEFKGPLSAMCFLQNEHVDILFLDIQMPELSGVDFLKGLKQKPTVIFTTAYKEYAIEGYQLDVVDYLLKPFTFQRFFEAVNKAIEIINLKIAKPVEQTEKKEVSQATVQNQDDVIVVSSNHKLHRVAIHDILYIESLGEYISYFLNNGERLVVLDSLKNVEQNLASNNFIRIHRSYIIPVNLVETLEGNRLKVGDRFLPIGRSYKETVLNKVFKK